MDSGHYNLATKLIVNLKLFLCLMLIFRMQKIMEIYVVYYCPPPICCYVSEFSDAENYGNIRCVLVPSTCLLLCFLQMN
jgi:hypothetical protein